MEENVWDHLSKLEGSVMWLSNIAESLGQVGLERLSHDILRISKNIRDSKRYIEKDIIDESIINRHNQAMQSSDNLIKTALACNKLAKEPEQYED